MQVTPLLFVIGLHLHQYQLRQTALQRLRHQQIVCITLPVHTSIAAGDEVIINGKMMDIREVVATKDHTLVYAWPDVEEDDLQKELDSVACQQNTDGDNDEVLGKVLKLFKLVFFQPTLPNSLTLGITKVTGIFSVVTASLTTVYLPVATPPPLFLFTD